MSTPIHPHDQRSVMNHTSIRQDQHRTMSISNLLNPSDEESHTPSNFSASSRSLSPDHPSQPRDFRSPYPSEASFFIWFHRIDLRMSWDDLTLTYNRHFHGNDTERKKAGLQCKWYRITERNKLPPITEQEQTSDGLSPFSMWLQTGRRFSWMKEHAHILPGKQALLLVWSDCH